MHCSHINLTGGGPGSASHHTHPFDLALVVPEDGIDCSASLQRVHAGSSIFAGTHELLCCGHGARTRETEAYEPLQYSKSGARLGQGHIALLYLGKISFELI